MDVDFCLLYKMLMKRYWSRLLALVLVVIGLTGCSLNSSPGGLSGDYSQDTLAVYTIKLALRCQKIHRIKHRLRQKRQKLMTLRLTDG